MKTLEYDELQRLLQHLGVAQDASEYHGALCGMLCHGAPQAESLIFDEMKQDEAAQAELHRFSKSALEQLAQPEFSPVVPDDDKPLNQRVEALAAWCSGFLYGFGTGKDIDIKQYSEEAQELIKDFTEISRADVESSDEENAEDEENAYVELIEYVRVGTQVIFLETRPQLEKPVDSLMDSTNGSLH